MILFIFSHIVSNLYFFWEVCGYRYSPDKILVSCCHWTNYHKISSVKQHTFSLLHVWRSEDQQGFTGCHLQGQSSMLSLAFLSFHCCLCSWKCGIFPCLQRASLHSGFHHHVACPSLELLLSISLMRTVVTASGPPNNPGSSPHKTLNLITSAKSLLHTIMHCIMTLWTMIDQI